MEIYLTETKDWIKIFVEDVFAFPDKVEDIAIRISKKIIQNDFFDIRKNIVGKTRYMPKPKTIAIVSIMIAMDKIKEGYDIDIISNECGINKRTLNDWKKNVEEYLKR